MLSRLTVVVLTGLAVVAATRADAVVLCARPRHDGTFNTAVKIRQACGKGETQLDPGALGLQGPPGAPGAAFLIKDANSQLVGTITRPPLTSADWEYVYFVRRVSGVPVSFMAYRSSIGTDSNQVTGVFSTDNACGGQAQIGVQFGVPTLPGAPTPSTSLSLHSYYYATGPFGPPPQFQSELIGRGLDQQGCTNQGGFLVPPDICCVTPPRDALLLAAPAAEFDPLSLGLVPPFHVEGP